MPRSQVLAQGLAYKSMSRHWCASGKTWKRDTTQAGPVCRPTSQWSGRFRAAHFSAAHRRVRPLNESGAAVMRRRWLKVTEETNALDYLERAGEFIRRTDDDNFAWKWVVLALHGALYGFAISACKGTDYTNVVNTTKSGRNHLISLDAALSMCADASWMGTLHGGIPLTMTESQQHSIKILKKTLRNNFGHFTPRGWSIEIRGLPQISMDVLDVIQFLAIQTTQYQSLNLRQRRRIASIVRSSKKMLAASKTHAEAIKHARRQA